MALLSSPWQLEDVNDVEGLIASVVDGYLGRRGAYLRPDLREDLDAYLLGGTWELYRRFDPSKASTPLSLSTYLTRRLSFAITDWFRSTFTDNRYRARHVVKEVLSLEVELEAEHDPATEDAASVLPSLSDTGRGRWQSFGVLHAAGYSFKELSEATGIPTKEISAQVGALRVGLRSLAL